MKRKTYICDSCKKTTTDPCGVCSTCFNALNIIANQIEGAKV